MEPNFAFFFLFFKIFLLKKNITKRIKQAIILKPSHQIKHFLKIINLKTKALNEQKTEGGWAGQLKKKTAKNLNFYWK